MSSFSTNVYPEEGKIIDARDCQSPCLIKVIAPDDIAEAFREYSSNFQKAAHLVGSYLLESGKADISQLDTYVFSLTFLYRHSIELLLKAIAFKVIEQSDARINFMKATFHNLAEILRATEATISSIRPNEEMIWLRSFLASFTDIDKESDSFRYPFHIVRERDAYTRCNQFSIERVFKRQTHLNLLNLANKFEATYDILEKWYTNDSQPSEDWRGLEPEFIEEGGNYYAQSVVGYSFDKCGFFPYVKAYLDSANYLKKHMKEQSGSGDATCANSLFLPMCYLYRNGIELSLKSIWFRESGEDLQTRCEYMYDRKHNVSGMWKIIKSIICKFEQDDEDQKYIAIIEDYCQQVFAFDDDASKFRYPVRKNMQVYFSHNTRFDFLHTGDFLEALNNILDGVKLQIQSMREFQTEMEAQYNGDMDSFIED